MKKKKTKKRVTHKRPRPKKKSVRRKTVRRKKANPRRRTRRVTHALGVGRSRHPKIVAKGTKAEMKRLAKTLRRAGVRNTQIGKRV